MKVVDTKNVQSNNQILLYMHAGSGNHGCEALVRTLAKLLGGSRPNGEDNITCKVLSYRAAEDIKYGIEEVCPVIPARNAYASVFTHAWYYLIKKLTGHGEPLVQYNYKNAGRLSDYGWAVSIGGDNYCYDDTIYELMMAHSLLNNNGVKTALVGCSIEPELISRSDVREDLKKYTVIAARESITYESLRNSLVGDGYEESRIRLIPDSAFTMDPISCELPDGFEEGHMIGINVSPLILGYESAGASGITLKNYECLIETIIGETDDKIALIPHVVWAGNDDRVPLRQLYDKYANTGRVVLIDDHTAPELKYIISKCRLFIGARTHATIAAYSSCVPTLVVGYSVKSRGIATDLFGTSQDYVIPVQELSRPDDLTRAFKKLDETATEQRMLLMKIMPEYIERASKITEIFDI